VMEMVGAAEEVVLNVDVEDRSVDVSEADTLMMIFCDVISAVVDSSGV
jgi:hypothetical protein